MGIEFQFWKMKNIVEIDGGDDGCTTVGILNATELYT